MSRRDLRSVGVFVAIAFALSWLVALPLWFGDGLATPWFPLVAMAVMATPAIAALVVVFFVERPQQKAWTLGLWPLRPVLRLLGYSALGIVVSIALVLVALPVGALLGVYPADFVNFSAFQQTLNAQTGAAGLPLSIGVLVALQVLLLPMAAFINLVPALGEELGWRGWLLPKLMPLGTPTALLAMGVVWGLWHAPLILLGYNYPDAPGWLALTAMVGMCIPIGAVFGWLRLRSGSVWPAALAHAAFNGAGGTYLLFAQAGEHIDTTQATILGWSGWIVPLVFVAALVAMGEFTPAKHPSGPASK
ncbi:CPBP family intramembrane glutamic endopeptidase [Nocardiopsis ansamitocini]|nr:CPBP family intramembrane glutamic endopeptidase [Nocardiopsis ansamitocini]